MIAWTKDTRRGSFESFFAAFGELSRKELLAQLPCPVLMTAVSTDSRTWSATLVLKIEPRPNAAKISIAAAGDSSADIETAAGRIYVGRTSDNDVVIPAPTISKRHAYFAKRELGWEIADLGSSNGTTLEGQPLRAKKRERIRRSLATIDFGPDAHFVFMMPESVADLLDEIHRSRGTKSALAREPQAPSAPVDEEDFQGLDEKAAQRGAEEEAAADTVLSAHPARAPTPPPERKAKEESDKARQRSTWQGKRPSGLEGDGDSLGKSTDKIPVKVGKTPQEIDDLNFEYALRAVDSLGTLLHRLEAVLKLNDQVVTIISPDAAEKNPDAARDALVKMRTMIRSIRMELVVGDRKPVEIFRAGA